MRKTLLFFIFLFLSVASFTQNAHLNWAFAQGGQNNLYASSIETDPLGNVVIMGYFNGQVDFDPGQGTFILSTQDSLSWELFIQKLSPKGEFIWARHIPTSFNVDRYLGHERENLQINAQGDIYISGEFTGTVDFDPGPNTFSLSTYHVRWRDVFILKIDEHGDFLWVKRIGGRSSEYFRSIKLDDAGNLFSAGISYSDDLKLGPDIAPPVEDPDCLSYFYILKMTALGEFVWAKYFSRGILDDIESTQTDNQGNIIINGHFSWEIDFDPGPGETILTSLVDSVTRLSNIFTLKLNIDGDFQWVTQIGSAGFDRKCTIHTSPNGDIYVLGGFTGTVDFDPSPGVLTRTSSYGGTAQNLFIQKLTPQGTLIWAKQIRQTHTYLERAEIDQINIDNSGNLYLSLTHNSILDVDPGPGTAFVGYYESINFPQQKVHSIVKWNPNGEFLWTKSLSLGKKHWHHRTNLSSLSLDPLDNIYLTGYFGLPVDMDPGSDSLILESNGSIQMFVAKWAQDSCANLSLAIDVAQDISCSNLGFIAGHGEGGEKPYAYSWDAGPLIRDTSTFIHQPGSHTLTVVDSLGCTRKSWVLIDGPAVNPGHDLGINITPARFRSGFPTSFWLNAFNDGCDPVSGTISLLLDPYLTFDSAVPMPDSISNHTLIWNVKDLRYRNTPFSAKIEVTVDQRASIGEDICLKAFITSKDYDNNTKNNIQSSCLPILNSYDPNDKLVLPQGLCEEGFIENHEALTYTVRFQNTGNADAINIFILDTLDTDLDLNSLRVVGKSHPSLVTEFISDRVIRFQFNDIHLPDSSTDEKNSQGYVMFEVKPQLNLPQGTKIINKAGIYFDFNMPIFTNTVLHTLTDSLPLVDTTAMDALGCNSYNLNGKIYKESGIFYQRGNTTGQCGNIIQLNLTLQEIDTSITIIGHTLTANEGGAHGLNTTYQWLDCSNRNLPILGANSRSFTPQNKGSFAVRISRGDCTEMSACHSLNTVGIDQEFQSNLRFYPNPSTGKFHIELGEYYQETKVEIYDFTGQLIHTQKITSQDKLSLDLPDSSGLYLIKVQSDNKEAIIKAVKK